MAVSRHTQKDIGNYEAKLLGPFTTRQCIFLGIGIIPTAIIGYVLMTAGVDFMTVFGLAIFIMAVPCFFAFGSSLTYDMKPEDYVKDYYKYHILAPRRRLYKTETLDDILAAQEAKKNTETEESDEADTESSETKGKKGKKAQQKELKTFGKMKIYPHKEDTEFTSFV